MIGYLEGIVKEREESQLILNVGGVGYLVFVPTSIEARQGESLELFVYTHVREDILALYGFAKKEEQQFFKLLISVSGIGPKVALAIISSASIEKLKSSISKGDSTLLSAVSGVGKKTAEKAVVELKNKVGLIEGSLQVGDSADILEALLALGFPRAEAIRAISDLPVEITDDKEKIKMALGLLRK